jgi:predicted enzyme related to lactoylglutathione lyase
MSGRVVHFEVPFEDQQRASAFSTEAFGWQLQPLPELSYVLVTTGPTTPMGGGPREPGNVMGLWASAPRS